MVYGADAVLPTKLQYGSPRVRAYQPGVAEEGRKDAIDLLEKTWDIAITRSARYYDDTMHVGFIPEVSR
jgi:hypothetical protein